MPEMDQLLFNRSYSMRTRLRMITNALGPFDDRSIICIGPCPPALRARLMTLGGEWTFVNESESLSFEDGIFDRAIVLDHLDMVPDDYAFMSDVHRVLKSAGLLYMDTAHFKRWTFWRGVRRLFGLEERATGRLREGYTEQTLFDILKDGFDLQETRTYSRFFSEMIETFVRLAVAVLCVSEKEDPDALYAERNRKRLVVIQSVAYPFYVITAQLDWVVCFTKGYRIRAVARRRLWKPRRTPVLRDGRTLADATLNTKIGTAAPF